MTFRVPNEFRLRTGALGTPDSIGNNGCFLFKYKGAELRCIASDGEGWEHVSVSLMRRCPTWAEMCAAKALFWGEEDVVVQFHPAKSEYVNFHAHCLHLWRPAGRNWDETPPSILVGPKGIKP